MVLLDYVQNDYDDDDDDRRLYRFGNGFVLTFPPYITILHVILNAMNVC